MGDCSDGVVEAGSLLPAVAEDFVGLHAGEGVLGAGSRSSVLCVVGFLAGQDGPAGALRYGTVTFSPDGGTLFANIQTPGIMLAITGPWRRQPARR